VGFERKSEKWFYEITNKPILQTKQTRLHHFCVDMEEIAILNLNPNILIFQTELHTFNRGIIR
jgi:hypothetical protein